MRGGGDSTDDETAERKAIEKAENAFIQCAECGNVFREDAVFCRMCGSKRPESPLAAQRDAMAKGPPSLKRVAREEEEAEEDDQAFLDTLRAHDPEKASHDIWGASAFQPSNREVASQFRQKERVEDVSDDENDAPLALGDDVTIMAKSPNKRPN